MTRRTHNRKINVNTSSVTTPDPANNNLSCEYFTHLSKSLRWNICFPFAWIHLGVIQTDPSDEYKYITKYTTNIIMLLYIWSWIYIGPNRALAKRKESQVSKETSKEKLVESTFFLFRFFSLFSLFSEVWTVAAISFWHWKSSCGSAAVWLSFVVISKKISKT